MRAFASLLAAAGVAASVSGCGGSGNSNPASPLSTTQRTIQPGDEWVWDYAYTTVDGSESGKTTETAQIGNLPAQPYITFTDTYALKSGNFWTDVSFARQDPSSKDMYLLGGPDGWLVTPVLNLPGTWKQGLTFTTSGVRTDGLVTNRTLTVIGTETVTVPAGTFNTWKMQIDNDIPNVSSTTGTHWYAPQIGESVKESYTTTYAATHAAPLSYNFTYELASTNVPH